MIDNFAIDGLFGNVNIKIPFDKDKGIKILIGENGTGKTTILNILYNSLEFNYYKLIQYNFQSITITFKNNVIAILNMKEVKDFVVSRSKNSLNPEMLSEVIKGLSNEEIDTLKAELKSNDIYNNEKIVYILRRNRYARHYPISVVIQALKQYFFSRPSSALTNFENAVKSNLGAAKILYFPTYRRIEEDLSNLSIEIDDDEIEHIKNKADNLIQFGMDDVIKRITSLKIEMERLSSVGLTKISSEILNQLVSGIPDINPDEVKSINIDNIKILLARVGNAMSEENKETIVKMLNSNKLNQNEKYLLYFVKKLVEIYEKQKIIDDQIKDYVSICNKYLKSSKKEITYNEDEVQLYIALPNNETPYLLTDFLNKMSSGEKQILSLFSKIYLSGEKEFIMMFDEPELSLSLFWQENLLTDIIKSNKIINMLTITHSPFIYNEDNLQKYANGIGEYINYGDSK
jgi:predicted ATP-binding protein involved in virulence